MFPYREDNKPFLIESHESKKIIEGEEVRFKLSFNEVKFNSRLNHALLSELKSKKVRYDAIEQALITDYTFSGRMFVVYVIELVLGLGV